MIHSAVNHSAVYDSATNNRSAIMRAKQALEEESKRHAGLAMSGCWVNRMPASVRAGIHAAKEGLDAWMKRTIEVTELLRPPAVKSPLVAPSGGHVHVHVTCACACCSNM